MRFSRSWHVVRFSLLCALGLLASARGAWAAGGYLGKYPNFYYPGDTVDVSA
jgi:hypothetical protein